jgi:hypothetical protein
METRLSPLQKCILRLALENRERPLPPDEQRGPDVLRSEVLATYYGFPANIWFPWTCADRPLRRKIDGRRCANKMFDVQQIGWDRYCLAQNAMQSSIRRLVARRLLQSPHGDGHQLTEKGVKVAKELAAREARPPEANAPQRCSQASRWERRYNELIEYKKRHGHCNTPADPDGNVQLARWVRTQRQQRSDGRLSEERIARLDRIGFIWDALDAQWQEMFAALVEYKSEHGNCNVPCYWPKNLKLADWVKRQRAARKRGTLAPDRESQLTQLGFEWNRASNSRDRLVPRGQRETNGRSRCQAVR